MEALQRSTIERNALQRIIRGLLGGEVEAIGDGVTCSRSHDNTSGTIHTALGERYRLVWVALCPSDGRQGRCADRQGDGVVGLLWSEAVNRLTVKTDTRQVGVRGCLDLIGQFVGTRILCRRSRDGDLCTFLETVLDERNGLCTIGISGLPSDDRRFGCAQREGDGVVVLSRCETRNEFAIYIDSLKCIVG